MSSIIANNTTEYLDITCSLALIPIPIWQNVIDIRQTAGIWCSSLLFYISIDIWFTGPLWGAAAKWTSERTVTVLGSVLMAGGLILLAWVKNTILVYISMIILGKRWILLHNIMKMNKNKTKTKQNRYTNTFIFSILTVHNWQN